MKTCLLHLLIAWGVGYVYVLPVSAADAAVLERRPIQRNSETRASVESVVSLGDIVRTSFGYEELVRERDTILGNTTLASLETFVGDLRADQRPPLVNREQWHALVNDYMGWFLRSRISGFDPEGALIQIVRDANDLVVRDYALQHIAVFIGARGKSANSNGSGLEILREAAEWKDSALAGTALINLYHLRDGIDDGHLAEQALAVASDRTAHEAARSTALQVGVLLDDPRFLAPAVEIARRSPVVAHRASAVRAIAAFGGPEQRNLLLQLRRRGPEPITNIANEALDRIENDR